MRDVDRKKICDKVQMPENIREFLEYIYTPFDLGILSSLDEDGYVVKEYRRSWLEHLYDRGVLDKIICDGGKVRYKAAHIAMRLECFIVVEKAYWISLPEDVRREINDRYIMNPDIWIPGRLGQPGKTEAVYPIEECLKILEHADTSYFYLAQCNCNNYLMNCEKDKYRVCIHFPASAPDINSPDGRGLSERVTREEAIEALKYTERQGLVHKAGAERENFCNCCSCCCIHHHNTGKYRDKLKNGFIETPYIIDLDMKKCKNCGACTKRCPFGALYFSGGKVVFHPEECWGCGVCRMVCPEKALQIKKRM